LAASPVEVCLIPGLTGRLTLSPLSESSERPSPSCIFPTPLAFVGIPFSERLWLISRTVAVAALLFVVFRKARLYSRTEDICDKKNIQEEKVKKEKKKGIMER